uniref:Kazal-like domain-containing protein n=1 Tax=Ditylum brightwellii TaxID=49249 RepID=A0A6V2FHR1_9STRA|mmetsp:Transcript_31919/g.48474  ORF Transcript_31919/g.48474 Transcript_31919/m.48474 type:complete len:147 (+) Transcript_31919:73-513(+)
MPTMNLFAHSLLGFLLLLLFPAPLSALKIDSKSEKQEDNRSLRGRMAQSCPELLRNKQCPIEYKPVTCGNGCDYDNGCFAQSVGFNLRNDCGVKTCPSAGIEEEAECYENLDFSPLICKGCIYDNDCFAKAAGFSNFLDECEPARL